MFSKDIFLTLPGNVLVFYRVCLAVFPQLRVFIQINFERMKGSLRILATKLSNYEKFSSY
jgi:hypothetical protein